MRKKLLAGLIVIVILIGITTPVAASADTDWETAMNRSLDWIRSELTPSPLVGSVGGEWAILALARADRLSANDPWLSGWFADLENLLADIDRLAAAGNNIQNPPSAGTFPSALRRWTDFQRVTLALGALGVDASNFNGRDLTDIYRNFVPIAQRHALNQTINVDAWALIALDSRQFSGDREQFVQSLLDTQRADGVWSLGATPTPGMGDIDITAMSVQALAPYYRTNSEVRTAVDRSLNWLRGQTFSDPEGTAQVIVALTALGSDFAYEASYYVNHLLRWFDSASGAFRRPHADSPINMMATEQAAYALVAYWRLVNNMNSLYDMRDALGENRTSEITTSTENIGLPGKHADVRQIPVTYLGRTFGDIQNHASRHAIEVLASRGIITGRNETQFVPSATMTRAEFAAIITRGLGLPDRPTAVFDDVPSNAWFFNVVGTAFYYEIVAGTSPATFNPHGTITRQEAAVMVARAAKLSGMNISLTDAEILNTLAIFGDYRTAASWAWSELAFCFREGILDDSEFYIEPLIPILRGEVAEMLYRLLDRANLL